MPGTKASAGRAASMKEILSLKGSSFWIVRRGLETTQRTEFLEGHSRRHN